MKRIFTLSFIDLFSRLSFYSLFMLVLFVNTATGQIGIIESNSSENHLDLDSAEELYCNAVTHYSNFNWVLALDAIDRYTTHCSDDDPLLPEIVYLKSKVYLSTEEYSKSLMSLLWLLDHEITKPKLMKDVYHDFGRLMAAMDIDQSDAAIENYQNWNKP